MRTADHQPDQLRRLDAGGDDAARPLVEVEHLLRDREAERTEKPTKATPRGTASALPKMQRRLSTFQTIRHDSAKLGPRLFRSAPPPPALPQLRAARKTPALRLAGACHASTTNIRERRERTKKTMNGQRQPHTAAMSPAVSGPIGAPTAFAARWSASTPRTRLRDVVVVGRRSAELCVGSATALPMPEPARDPGEHHDRPERSVSGLKNPRGAPIPHDADTVVAVRPRHDPAPAARGRRTDTKTPMMKLSRPVRLRIERIANVQGAAPRTPCGRAHRPRSDQTARREDRGSARDAQATSSR